MPTERLEYVMLTFARLTPQAKQVFVKPLKLIRPAAAARCLKLA